MKKTSLILILLLGMCFIIKAQQFTANYDESKVPRYKLPDPLMFNDGRKVNDIASWAIRRDEIISLFEKEVYGVSPEWKGKLTSTEISSDNNALDGKAVRKEIKITLTSHNKSHEMILLLFLPKSPSPVSLFLGLNFGGNHTVTDDPGIGITKTWVRNDNNTGAAENKASEAGRGKAYNRWQVNEIISAGYGLATMYYGDIDPDFDDNFKNGVHSLYSENRNEESWGTIAAWAWGLSRILDYLETNPQVDSKKVIVIGHSRLGKAALWAGAADRRFFAVISNDSGCGGAALSMRRFGETVGRINTSFPHWFNSNFKKYNENEDNLPVDQHELLSLIAPRPLYVASAEEDQWADPKGEFLACLFASPVYTLLGKNGITRSEMPAINQPVTGTVNYHIRSGGHNVTLYDWQQYLKFADSQIK
ncbi:MAG TPA: hypothetical protein VMV47_07225 [Bacteroidales bacterium]|nr:hypothetical protein [Bacteroidales bacterium]